MSNSTISYIVVSIFAVIILSYMFTMMQDLQEIAVTETLTMVGDTPNNLANVLDMSYPVTLTNVTDATVCTASNYTYNTTTATLIASSVCVDGDYYFDYRYQRSATVFGMDLNFMGLLVFLGVALYVAYVISSIKSDIIKD